MNTLKTALGTIVAAITAALLVAPVWAEEPEAKQSAAPDMNEPAMMAKMMEMTKLGEQHKMLADLAGTWDYTVKMWMNPSAPPQESKGKGVRKAIMDGRYYTGEFTGKMEMPGPDGKPTEMVFEGRSVDGYDNVKQKFVSTWMDNMGTGIMMAEGTYDEATRTFTYHAEFEAMPGMKTKVRELIKLVDKDHHTLEWYEDRGGKEVKTMEISYTRQK